MRVRGWQRPLPSPGWPLRSTMTFRAVRPCLKTKPNNIKKMEGKNQLPQAVLLPPHTLLPRQINETRVNMNKKRVGAYTSSRSEPISHRDSTFADSIPRVRTPEPVSDTHTAYNNMFVENISSQPSHKFCHSHVTDAVHFTS